MRLASHNPFSEAHLASNKDYHAAWDVLEMNGAVSEWLAREVRNLRGRRAVDTATKIGVIIGPPGYGKTHLFGRIAEQVGHDVFFAFIPGFEAKTEPLEHVRWYAIEALFRASNEGHAPVEWALAELCQPAFAKYFEGLAPTLAARHKTMRHRLTESPLAVLEVVRSVKSLEAFLKLADSLTSVLTDQDVGVVRALSLGWAPAPWGAYARRWLQGQDLPEAVLKELRLAEDPPLALKVLEAIPALFRYERPMMICCDQIEGILQTGDNDSINRMSVELMALLHAIPMQIVLSCFQDQWEKFLKNSYKSFTDRVHIPVSLLDDMTPEQAIQLVRARLGSWPDRPTNRSGTWPFNEASIAQLVRDHAPTPRGLIQLCSREFDDWLENETDAEIDLGEKTGRRVDPEILFLQIWKREIEAIQNDDKRTAEYLPEDRIYRGLFEALNLAQSARHNRDFGGIRVAEVHDKAVRAVGKVQRPAARVVLTAGTGSVAQSVVVAYTKLEKAQSWTHYWRALADASSNPVAGAVLICPKRDLNMGKITRDSFDAAKRLNKIRLMPLEDYPQTYQATECLAALIDRAYDRDLILGNLSLSVEDCRAMVIKTGVIDNLELFQMLGHWRKSAKPAAAAKSASVQTPTPPVVETIPQPSVKSSPEPVPDSQTSSTTASTNSSVQSQKPTPQPEAPAVDHSDWAEDKLVRAVKKLKLLGQEVQGDGFEVGPTFARLRVVPLGKTNFKGVSNKAVDLRISLGLEVVPIVGSQAGCISIDIQRPDRATVPLAEVLASAPAELSRGLAFPVGEDVGGQTHWLNLAEPSDCHLLVAGTTGSGKSEFLRAAVAALAARMGPDRVQFLLIDPKRVTFNLAESSPYLQAPVAHDIDEALPLIEACMREMDRRYAVLEERKLSNVSELSAELPPRIVIVIDEFAGFLEDKESKKVVNALLKRIGAMARAAGIHLILSTQRPDKDIVTPVLRENLPGRIALRVSSKAGSDLILGSPEAENLLGKGDLFWKKGGELLRLQSPYVSQADLETLLRIGPS